MRGKFSAVIREFEEGGGGGFLANKEKLLFLNFRGLFCICSLVLGTFLPAERDRSWERRTGGASSGSSPITH